MLKKTRGIVLSYTKFKESSIIVRIFTERYGLQSFIVNGLRSTKSKKGMALYQPLTLLEMVIYYKASGQIHRISEAKCVNPFYSIPFDIKKSSMAIFFTDLLVKVLKEGEENPEEFDYIFHSIAYLDEVKTGFENFHLEFMIGISRFLGFGIINASEAMEEQTLENTDPQVEQALVDLVNKTEDIKITSEVRRKALLFLVAYFQDHLDHPFELKSLKILNQVFA